RSARQTVRHAAARAAPVQAEHQAGAFRRAAVDARPQAQRAVVAAQGGQATLFEGEIRPPDQRAVAVHPYVIACAPMPERVVKRCAPFFGRPEPEGQGGWGGILRVHGGAASASWGGWRLAQPPALSARA